MEHKELCETVEKHEKRITDLEKNEAVTNVRFENLCKNVGGLTKVLWFLSTTLFLTLMGFFIFVIEKGIN